MTNEIPDALSDALRKLVRRGNMTYLSVVSSDDVFKVAYRGVDSDQYRYTESVDIVDALMQAVTGRRSKPQRQAKAEAPKRAAPAADFEDLI